MKKYYLIPFMLLFTVFAKAQIVNIPDPAFKAKLLASSTTTPTAQSEGGYQIEIDINNDNEIQVSEIQSVTRLKLANSNIADLTGIEAFVNLRWLEVNNNDLSGTVDLSALTQLYRLECQYNNITSIVMPTISDMSTFDCSYNQMSSLDITELNSISELRCNNNPLTSLLLGDLTLYMLFCQNCQLATLDLSQLSSINGSIHCENNQIVSLDVSGINLLELYCENNQLSSLNVDSCIHLNYLSCQNNQLEILSTRAFSLNCTNNQLKVLYLKNNFTQQSPSFANNPDLQYICADPAEISNVQNSVNALGYTNCEVNSNCSYTPGAFYRINLTQKYDAANDGCDIPDPAIPNLKFNLTNSNVNSTIVSDALGNYIIPVQAGSHTVTPVFENPYFTAVPPSATIVFPADTSPAMQNFCITPNGVHPDVEVTLFNTTAGVPGFDSDYRIVYRNKGTTTVSGAVNVSFDDATLDFISAGITPDSQSTGTLSWNYTNLQPFESRTIDFTLNLNSPVETPPLNQDDVLHFTADISLAADEAPTDNITTLNQTVFNALDPNDKTCLEGDTILPTMVGEYVHYKIRFENTGNYPATVVTVKDVIDTSKFIVSTLTPITASHPFITRITNNNQVEFVFDNIMLPFDDANNDGYVVFKIKTKPTLVLGDQLSNTAGIYFNYNAPVITNTAVTTVAVPLGVDGNPNAFGFALYPNPVKEVLNISSKTNANIDSVVIYNTLGQEVMKVLPALGEHAIDVSKLSVGHYVVSVTSETGHWAAQFIKD